MSSKIHLNQAISSHLIEIKADETPDKELLIFEKNEHKEEVLTYGDIHENANKIAAMFIENGLEKGDTYALFMKNHPEFIYSFLAGQTMGAIMVPIDPRSRGKRLRFLLKNSGVKGVVVSGECLSQLEEIIDDLPDIKFVCVAYQKEQNISISDKFQSLNETLEKNLVETIPQKIMDVRHPMQIIYTSGTTGDPKGVMIRNNRFGMYNIVTKLVWKYKKEDVLYTGLSLTHGNAQAVTLFPSLATGVKAVFSAGFTRSRIWDICRKYDCTSFSLLGGMMSGIFNVPKKENDQDNPVKTIISAGTPKAIWEDFENRFDTKILEWYGAVEGGFAYKAPGKGPIGSFGKPIPGMMQFTVVDEDDNKLGDNETGELICKMMRGDTKVDYLGQPEASEEKTKGGWLRTGDMVHKDANGWYFFDHRKGSELRRAGDFIQPDHIEKVIGEHPDISEVSVYGIPAASGAPGESDLVAAISPFNDADIDPSKIFEKCLNDLEKNFIPTYFQIVDEIPKTISQKPLTRVLKDAFSPEGDKIFRTDQF